MVIEIQQKMSPEEEIQKLEQQIEQKKRELAKESALPHEEKEILREVLKEHIESLKSSTSTVPLTPYAPTPPAVAPTIPLRDMAADAKKKEEEERIVRTFVEKAMTGTIEDAVKEAQKISPYLLDELHDHLIDDFYEKLVALRKIKKL